MNRTFASGALASLLLSAAFASPAPAQEAPPAQDAAKPAPPQTATTSPFLWRIEGKGTSGYLYGTIHLTDDRVLALPKAVESAFNGADAFYAEIEATPKSQAQVQKAAALPPGVSLDAFVNEATWQRIDGRLAAKSIDVRMRGAIKRMEPWAISALLPTLDYFEDQLRGKAPLDQALYQRAAKAGKAVGGLETVGEQLAVFSAFSREEHTRMLVDALDQLDAYEAKGRNVVEEMIGAWRSGAEDKLMQLLDDGFGKDPVLKTRMEQELLWGRNVLIADRIARKMSGAPDKTAFFAVGALHLPDPKKPEAMDATQAKIFATKKGLVTLLRQRGYTLTRVGAAEAMPAGK